jgi:putative copper resistance protein D
MTIVLFLIATRWVNFCSEFALFGGAFFWFYMGRERSAAAPAGLPRTFRATGILLGVAAPLAAISGLAWLIGILANMTGGFSGVGDPANLRVFFFDTPFGPVAIIRLTLLAAALVVAALPWQNRTWFSALLAIGGLLLMSQAWLGHAAEGGVSLYGTLMIVAYSVHMLAAAAWVGGLAPLLFALTEQRAREPHEASLGSFDILSRYSLMGTVAVTLIVISGIANAAFHVAAAKLFDSAYGDVLLAKVSLVAMMLVLAYVNRFVAMPRLRRATSKQGSQIARLRASVGFELALGLLVVGLAAVLGITPPPR